jgi:putative endopeptidase
MFMKPLFPLRAALAALALALLAHAEPTEQRGPGNHGIVLANMDPSVKPGDNFYVYTNGGWLKRTVIPPDRSRIGVFNALSDLSNKHTLTLIEEAGKAHPAAGSNGQKIADLYHSYMDEAGIEAHGLKPVEPYLKAVAAIGDKTQLAHALG